MRSQAHPPLNNLPQPNQSANLMDNLTTVVDSLPHPHFRAPQRPLVQSKHNLSSDLDTDHGDMMDETIKQVRHKFYQTILTSDVNTGNTAYEPNTGTSKVP